MCKDKLLSLPPPGQTSARDPAGRKPKATSPAPSFSMQPPQQPQSESPSSQKPKGSGGKRPSSELPNQPASPSSKRRRVRSKPAAETPQPQPQPLDESYLMESHCLVEMHFDDKSSQATLALPEIVAAAANDFWEEGTKFTFECPCTPSVGHDFSTSWYTGACLITGARPSHNIHSLKNTSQVPLYVSAARQGREN